MFLSLLLEVILLTVIVGGSFYGYKKGLFRMAAGPIRTALCLVISLSLCDPVGEAVIAPLIRTPVRSYLLEFMQERVAYSTDGAIARIPTLLRMAGAAFGVSYDNSAVNTTVETVVDAFTEPLIALISRAVAFILLFILSKFLFKLLVYLADSFLGIGIIGRLNRLLGAALSICIAIACAWAFTSAVDYLFRLDIFENSRLVGDFDGGLLYRFFKNLNVINLLLSF